MKRIVLLLAVLWSPVTASGQSRPASPEPSQVQWEYGQFLTVNLRLAGATHEIFMWQPPDSTIADSTVAGLLGQMTGKYIAPDKGSVMKIFNLVGAMGWEMVGCNQRPVDPKTGSDGMMCYFKRPRRGT